MSKRHRRKSRAVQPTQSVGGGLQRKAVSTPVNGVPVTSYEAADPISQELGNWHPALASADRDWLGERVPVTARIRDMVRNNGWASGLVRHEVDTVIGSSLRLSYKLDYQALAIDADLADDICRRVEGRWRVYANDPDKFCDAARHDSIPGLFGLAYRHAFIEGDAIGLPLWMPDRGGWATTLQIVDPDRLSNPYDQFDTAYLRAGVELDTFGAATGYHFRRRHPNDQFGAFSADSMIWDYVPRETPWGRPRVIHYFDKERAGLTRGIGRLASVLEPLFMDHRLSRAEIQASVINAILAVILESPFDPDMVAQALAPNSETLGPYQDMRAAFHQEKRLTFGGAQVATTFPGEKLTMPSPSRPNANFADFESAILRKAAAGAGTSYEQLSRDWSNVNYSSARAALIEVWRGYTARREDFTQNFCTPFFGCWLEEDLATGAYDDLIPEGTMSFHQAKAAWLRCKWIGPGRGWVDPTKEAEASGMRLQQGLSTQEAESAEQGRDWQEDIDQQARERRYRAKQGVPDPIYAKATPAPPPPPPQTQDEKDAA